MPSPAVRVDGATELRQKFRSATGNTKDLRAAYRRVAKVVEGESRSRAPGGTRQQGAAAKVLLGRGTSSAAQLAIRNTATIPFGLGAFLGARRWQQFPDWVGNDWDLLAGDGPYVIAEAMRDEREQILETFEEEIGAALRAAGLEVTVYT